MSHKILGPHFPPGIHAITGLWAALCTFNFLSREFHNFTEIYTGGVYILTPGWPKRVRALYALGSLWTMGVPWLIEKAPPLLFLEFILLRVIMHVSLVGLVWIKPQLPTVDQWRNSPLYWLFLLPVCLSPHYLSCSLEWFFLLNCKTWCFVSFSTFLGGGVLSSKTKWSLILACF